MRFVPADDRQQPKLPSPNSAIPRTAVHTLRRIPLASSRPASPQDVALLTLPLARAPGFPSGPGAEACPTPHLPAAATFEAAPRTGRGEPPRSRAGASPGHRTRQHEALPLDSACSARRCQRTSSAGELRRSRLQGFAPPTSPYRRAPLPTSQRPILPWAWFPSKVPESSASHPDLAERGRVDDCNDAYHDAPACLPVTSVAALPKQRCRRARGIPPEVRRRDGQARRSNASRVCPEARSQPPLRARSPSLRAPEGTRRGGESRPAACRRPSWGL